MFVYIKQPVFADISYFIQSFYTTLPYKDRRAADTHVRQGYQNSISAWMNSYKL